MSNTILIKNIKQLLQVNRTNVVKGPDMKHLPLIENAWLLIADDIIKAFGEGQSFREHLNNDDVLQNEIKVYDATGKIVMPAFCDSHTHIVYAGTRETEFVDRINGLSYEAIAAREIGRAHV